MIGAPHDTTSRELNLADRFVDRNNLHPPVPIREVVERYADVREVYLPEDSDVDAIVHGLHSDARPLVILNSRRPATRARFTYAHELGHLLIPWHLGTIPCHVPDDHPDPAGSGLDREAMLAAMRQEEEANRFASRVLLPMRYLRTLVDLPVPQMLRAIETAQVSPEAGLIALVNSLPPGFLFVLMEYGDTIDNWFGSFGTVNLGAMRGGRLDTDRLARAAESTGRDRLLGRWVWWARYPETISVTVPADDWRTLLTAILAEVRPGEGPQDSSWMSINGVAAAAHSDARSEDPARIAAFMSQRFANKPELNDICEHPRFGDFIAARAVAFGPARPKR